MHIEGRTKDQASHWYVVELITKFRVKGGGNRVHRDWVLLKADSVKAAQEMATRSGESANGTYTTREGEKLTAKFRGLADLYYMPDVLDEAGTLLFFEEEENISEEEIQSLLSAPADFAADLPIE